ncbi:MAG: hypothetical protein LC799_28020, partial [Actinobacteria bacterium]|nr:hypothetical protein [Actinomycetota bacterium]
RWARAGTGETQAQMAQDVGARLGIQQANSPLLVANVQARVHTRCGAVSQTEEGLCRAQHEFTRAEADPAGWLTKVIDEAELHAMTGYAYSYLAEHDRSFADRAVEEVSIAIRLRDPPAHPRFAVRPDHAGAQHLPHRRHRSGQHPRR